MKVLFGMALRQMTGFVESLMCLVALDRAVPDFITLSRRQKTLAVNIPYRGFKGPLHLLIDSTGIKVEGAGEGHVRKHGAPSGGPSACDRAGGLGISMGSSWGSTASGTSFGGLWITKAKFWTASSRRLATRGQRSNS